MTAVPVGSSRPQSPLRRRSRPRDVLRLFPSPATADERVETAGLCVVRLAIKMPALVDGIDNSVERVYTGWPDRLYLIDTGGRIRFKSAPGPYGFSTRDLERSLRELLIGSTARNP